MAPPSASALAGYTPTYVQDFPGTTLPGEWTPFNGPPAGDPGGEWLPSQVTVGGGILQLTTQQSGNTWLSGGVSLGTLPQEYGAYFVRSRMTGPGPTQVELLWPTTGWPPEVDFDETYGDTALSQATDHYDANNDTIHENLTSIGGVPLDMTQWHTWGIVWTPTSLIYTVDGQEWGSVTQSGAIPNVPMTLNIQQQTWCGVSPAWACPNPGTVSSTQVDWVEIYTPGSSPTTTTTSPPPTTTTTTPTTTTTKPPTTTTTKPPTTTTTKPPTTTTTTPVTGSTTTTTTTTTIPTTTTTRPTTPSTLPSVPPNSDVAQSVAVSPFAENSASLSTPLKDQVAALARRIKTDHNHTVLLVGMAGRVTTTKKRLIVSRARADAVAVLLRSQLREIHAKGVTISAFAQYSFNGATLGKALTSKLKTASVVALIH
jgi:outer membrane protein OmpA-like peptidoglycan-associated protein